MMLQEEWNLQIPQWNKETEEKTAAYIDALTKPPGSLGRLEKIAAKLAGMTGDAFPEVDPAGILVFAADHGIVEEGVSAFPQEITAKMAQNFLHGGAAINVFAKQIGAHFQLIDIGMAENLHASGIISRKINNGTANFLKENAMTKEEAVAAIQAGKDAAETMIHSKGIKCLILGEMGIGNTSASSAVTAALSGKSIREVTGPGTGLSKERLHEKQRILEQALENRNVDSNDPIDVLTKVGGFEIAGMAGAMLAAAAARVPVLVDGFISSTAALTAQALAPRAADYMFIGHRSAEPGHTAAIDMLAKEPLLDLEMRLGEGTGAALAFPILQAACAMVREMATFSDLETY
ncbi:nicotinate-nucleotide--dimethylbenzimidazole phosphoribosyltransferase [Bacillus piscicola]|uniref:nicotinate-nucleotide--dimethylbenzimidazole phosphoribosyltransferase n=1 Tax=Bacillus piscicola TaxID=1632684 RepID=UPI001F09A0C5|nr:nicotinate-nucleotide--dimethylbenzimidazole phosphoribosyltransferase [Bacillus piscicola]